MDAPATPHHSLTTLPQWQALKRHAQDLLPRQLRDLFADQPDRGERLTAEAAGLYLDFSKQRVTDDTVRLLLDLADARGVRERRDAMFRGDRINATEDRAVLHVALRAPASEKIVVDGKDVVPAVHAVLDRMAAICARVRNG